MACVLGRGGSKVLKREGDGATPLGRYAAREVLFNPKAQRRPRTGLPVRAIAPRDGWCDAVSDRNYNRPVRHPYPASAERLWRDDGVYDLVVVLDYNIRPRSRNLGSAIFMHVARPGYLPTEGCIALSRADLLKVLRVVRRGSAVDTRRA
ncbi:MAG: L,D-transpeptidase family protein [Hyphomicrobium sp.]